MTEYTYPIPKEEETPLHQNKNYTTDSQKPQDLGTLFYKII